MTSWSCSHPPWGCTTQFTHSCGAAETSRPHHGWPAIKRARTPARVQSADKLAGRANMRACVRERHALSPPGNSNGRRRPPPAAAAPAEPRQNQRGFSFLLKLYRGGRRSNLGAGPPLATRPARGDGGCGAGGAPSPTSGGNSRVKRRFARCACRSGACRGVGRGGVCAALRAGQAHGQSQSGAPVLSAQRPCVKVHRAARRAAGRWRTAE